MRVATKFPPRAPKTSEVFRGLEEKRKNNGVRETPPKFSSARYFHISPMSVIYTAPMKACLLAFFFCLCHFARADEQGSTVEFDRTLPDTEEAAPRLTLELRDAPLLQVLHVLSQNNASKFRYGIPPDAVVSIRWNDEEPMASLDTLIRGAGWKLQRDGGDYFLLPGDAKTGSWAQWTGALAPSRDELTGALETAKVSIKDATVVSQKEAAQLHWKPIASSLEAARKPGIALAMPKAGTEIWLRSVVQLKVVPRGTRLMLDATGKCDVLVNGAPLARGYDGLKTFDVEPLLRRGANTLVVRWRSANSPMLRYEWVFAGGAGQGLPGESAREPDK